MAEFESCYADFDGVELKIGNRHIERRWRVEQGLLYATSCRDGATGREWLARPAQEPSFYPPVALENEPRRVRFEVRRHGVVERPSLVVELEAAGATAALVYRFQIFPDARGVAVQLVFTPAQSFESANAAPEQNEAPSGVETAPHKAPRHDPDGLLDVLERFEIAPLHLKMTQVTLRDQTDIHNELAFESEWMLHPNEARIELAGNLFCFEDTLTGDGLILLKHAPLPHARPIKTVRDMVLRNGHCATFGHGLEAGGGTGYRCALLAYSGGPAGRITALQTYQRQWRGCEPGRDGLLLSNTWGDRSRDACINEAFMRREIEAGARLGVDVIQIDDGWQRGVTSNSVRSGGVWQGYWAADPQFWEVHPERFPNGLEPLIAEARRHGMQFGLWFAPDSADSFANWERDAEAVLHLHRALGVNYFKIDSVKALSPAGERHLGQFFDTVLRESAGRVVFDLDVTAEIRPGYFGLMQVGPIFVENRYTDWRRYYPHATLRNLWKLAHSIDPLRLRMEFLNHARNVEKYPDDPLAPAAYRPATLFATVMLSSPLGWFEVSNLPPGTIEEVAPLVRLWKQHRAALFSGPIIPIGLPPDGVAWTGFACVGPNDGGYLLVFRELNSRPEWHTMLPVFTAPQYRVTVLSGNGHATLAAGRLSVAIPEPLDFLWVQVEPVG